MDTPPNIAINEEADNTLKSQEEFLQILIILPDPTLIRIYRNLFAVNGYTNSVSTTDPAEALEIVRKGGIGLVLTGQMASSDPLVKMLRAIRAIPEGKAIPCILLGASTAINKEFFDIKTLGLAMPLIAPANRDMLQQATDNVLRMAAS